MVCFWITWQKSTHATIGEFFAAIGLTDIGGEFEKADIQHPTSTHSARYFAQVQSNTGEKCKSARALVYVLYLVGLLDLLGLSDDVFPGVPLLSPRR
ncbi:hypothetical protein SAMN04487974_12145 [Pelagibacterium luteolum]|uniref:Uncharacterized protein n=1 Tax=Pelagibacterium luteolum TaxID=440168 RepID=A0A1G7ZQM3_9HYPH|nr:hypothetical protein SAMN04487974_12145 [Pelagibacterium luteolum]